jgi:hypothetical protein
MRCNHTWARPATRSLAQHSWNVRCVPIRLDTTFHFFFSKRKLQSKQNHENRIVCLGLCKPFCCLQIRFVPSWFSRFRIVVVRLRRSRKRGKAPWCHWVSSTLSRSTKRNQNLAIVCEKLLPRFLRPVIEKVSAQVGGDDLTSVWLENIHPDPNVINRCYPNLPQPTFK